MIEPSYLTNQLLIAMPTLVDPNFFRTVTLICEHSASGAMGIVINRPTRLSVHDLLEHLDMDASAEQGESALICAGGPVHQEQGFVLHAPLGTWESTLAVSDEVGVTTSRDILLAIGRGAGPSRALVALGYAGWGPGQLEREIGENAWLSGPVDPAILFDTPFEQRWEAAAALLGVDLTLLSGEAGHA